MKLTRSLGVFQSVTISAFIAVALSLLLEKWINKDWRPASAVAIFTASLLPLLYIVFKEQAQKLRKDEEAQLNRLDQPYPVFGSTHHGVIFANENGLGITYLPAFEIFLKWEEITGYVLFQKDISTYTKNFIDDLIKPPSLPGRAHTLLITSTRPDMPAIPVEMPKTDLEFWSDVIDTGKSEPHSLATYPKKADHWCGRADQRWANSKFLLCWVLFAGCGLIWMLRPGVSSMPMFVYFYFNTLGLLRLGEPVDTRTNLPQTLLRARGQNPKPDALAGIADGAIWLCQRGVFLNRIGIKSIESISIAPLEMPMKKQARLSVKLISGEVIDLDLKTTTVYSIGAELQIIRPDLKILGSPDLVPQPI